MIRGRQRKGARRGALKVRCSVYDGMFHVFQMGLDRFRRAARHGKKVAGISTDHLPDSSGSRRNGREKVKTRRKETEDRARLNLLAFLKRELKSEDYVSDSRKKLRKNIWRRRSRVQQAAGALLPSGDRQVADEKTPDKGE